MKILKIIVNIVLITIVVMVIHTMVSNLFFEARLEVREPYEIGKRTLHLREAEPTVQVAQTRTNDMGTMRGYNIIAKLEIPRINLTTSVLEEYSESALRVSVTRFAGPNPNEIGNLVITGHNYIDSNMFSRLNRLRPGDKLYLTDESRKKDRIYNI